MRWADKLLLRLRSLLRRERIDHELDAFTRGLADMPGGTARAARFCARPKLPVP
jgi:hypothetical protein